MEEFISRKEESRGYPCEKKMRLFRNKQFKQITCFLIAVVMLICVAPINVAAAVSSGKSVTVKNPYSSMTFVGNTGDTIVDNYGSVASTNTGKVLSVGATFSYNKNDRIDNYDAGRIFPITVSAVGTLSLSAIATYLGDEATVRIYTSADCTGSLGSVWFDTSGVAKSTYVDIPQAGTYYLVCETWCSASSGTAFTNTIDVDLTFAPLIDMNLNANAWYSVGDPSYNQEIYYRVVLNAASYLTVHTDDKITYDITDSRKSIIRNYIYLSDDNGYHASTYLPKGTYYIHIDSASTTDGNYKIKYTTSGHPAMKNKTWTTIYPSGSNEVTYLAVKPTVDGYITLNLYGGESYDTAAYVTLCNSSLKELTEEEYISTTYDDSNKAVFGVKKNTTYYLKVTSVGTKGCIKYTQTKVSEKSGKKKAKAVEIKKNKKIQGTIAAGDKKADWYKIKVTKKGKVKLFTTGNASGYIYLQMYYANGKKFGSYVTVANRVYDSDKWVTNVKLNKGTYYIKVYRGNDKTSGNYTLKWK